MINYKPEDAVRVWPEGDYQATLEGVEETTSQAGNSMHALTFTVYDGDGKMTVTDYIVYPAFTWKLKKLAIAFGAEAAFDAGTFSPADFEKKNLAVKLGIQKAKGDFDERNRVLGYAVKGSDSLPADDSDLPF